MSDARHDPTHQTVRAMRARYERLTKRLAEANDAEALAEIKTDIIGLFDESERAIAAYVELRDEVRSLATAWKALATAQRAMTAAPVRVDHLGASTYVEKGWSRLSTGDASGAEAALRQALQLAPENIDAATMLAWAMLTQDRFEEARLLLERVFQRDASSALGLTVAGMLALREKNVSVAIERLNKAVEYSEFDRRAALYAHLHLGVALRESGNATGAVTMFRRALELGPNLLEAAFELGCTLWQAGDESSALSTWRSAASSNKFSPWGKRCAEMLVMHERGEVPEAVQA